MNKGNIAQACILGLITLPIITLAQLNSTMSLFTNNDPNHSIYLEYYVFPDTTKNDATPVKCIATNTIPKGPNSTIVYGGATAGGTKAGCGGAMQGKADITAIVIHNPTDSTKGWVVCTGANETHKTSNFANFITFTSPDTLPTRDHGTEPSTIPAIVSCTLDGTCQSAITNCANFPDP